MTPATMKKILKLQATSNPRVGTLGADVTPSVKWVHMLQKEWDLPQHLEVTFTGQRCGQSRDQHHVLVREVRKEEAVDRIDVDIIETGWDLDSLQCLHLGKYLLQQQNAKKSHGIKDNYACTAGANQRQACCCACCSCVGL